LLVLEIPRSESVKGKATTRECTFGEGETKIAKSSTCEPVFLLRGKKGAKDPLIPLLHQERPSGLYVPGCFNGRFDLSLCLAYSSAFYDLRATYNWTRPPALPRKGRKVAVGLLAAGCLPQTKEQS